MKTMILVLLSVTATVAQDVHHRWVNVGGVNIFYRESGSPERPTILFLHGTPSSSVMFDDLIRMLGNNFHLVAPDYPAHGYSDTPDPQQYAYTFDNIGNTIDTFTVKLGLSRYALYMQDYGAPIGFRLALRHPERITALLVQNGNAYIEGFPLAQDPNGELWTYWRTKNAAYEKEWMDYYQGLKPASAGAWRYGDQISPDRRMIDWAVMQKPGTLDIFLDLWFDYRTNVESYPAWQKYLRQYQPPTLITWGEKDRFFTADGARAYLKDVPKAELHLMSGGHWAGTDDNVVEIAKLIRDFFAKHKIH